MIEKALHEALLKHTLFNSEARTCLVELVIFCLDSVITQHGAAFYKQKQGIVTGDNHSVSVANIAMHCVIRQIAEVLRQAEIFKRYIDDIMWISQGEAQTHLIKHSLKDKFAQYGLDLTFREVCTLDESKHCLLYTSPSPRDA